MEPTVITKRNYFSKAKKFKILSELDDGTISLTDLARKHGVHPVTVHRWRRDMRKEEDKNNINVQELLAELEKLTEENKNLKKAIGSMAVDKEILQTANEILKKKQRQQELNSRKK